MTQATSAPFLDLLSITLVQHSGWMLTAMCLEVALILVNGCVQDTLSA